MKNSMTVKMALTLLLIAAPLSACGGSRQADSQMVDKLNGKPIPSGSGNTNAGAGGQGTMKTIDIINTKGANIGKATLTQQADGVKIHVDASGLIPGKHGIHLHETGACAAPDFKTAGGHWNPDSRKHGPSNDSGHLGDLANIEAGADGKVNADLTAKHISLNKGDLNTVFDRDGTALMIHEKEDDGKTDPSGNSGNRIACGVLK